MGVEDSKFKHTGNSETNRKTMKEKNESLEPKSWPIQAGKQPLNLSTSLTIVMMTSSLHRKIKL